MLGILIVMIAVAFYIERLLMAEAGSYIGINVRSNKIVLSQEFCKRYVKDNKFVAPEWDSERKILKLTFYPIDSDIGFRIPLVEYPGRITCVPHAKFFRRLQTKIGRYKIFDAELNRSGAVVLMFKMKSK